MTADPGTPISSTNQQKDEPVAAAGRSDPVEPDARQPAAIDLDAGTAAVPDRGGEPSTPLSPAAAKGEHPAPAVEQTQTGAPAASPTEERPVTGVHRAAAPSGEVAPE